MQLKLLKETINKNTKSPQINGEINLKHTTYSIGANNGNI